MKIAITFEHTDLIQYIEDMLAVKGMKPVEPVVFQRKRNKGPTHNAVPGKYEVVVLCEDTTPRETCPMCQHTLRAESTSVTEPPSRSTSREPAPEPPARPLNLMAGESTEPPFGGDEAAPEGEGGGMASIIAQSRAIEAVKTREQEARRFSKKPDHE